MRKISEHEHQVNLVRWFDLTHKEHRGRLLAIPNGGQRHVRVAQKLKAEGVRRGVPDLFLPVPVGEFHGLFIELKAQAGRLTAEQIDWIDHLNNMGYCAIVCKGFDVAAAAISLYLNGNQQQIIKQTAIKE